MDYVDPRELLTPKRLDYVVKWRFFRHITSGNDPDSERVYRWHIERRTGGREIDYRTTKTTKHSVDQYVECCHELLSSICSSGYDNRFPVSMGSNGLPLDGAHRIAACLAVGEMVAVERVCGAAKRDWTLEWFSDQGMPEEDLARLVSDWCSLRDGR